MNSDGNFESVCSSSLVPGETSWGRFANLPLRLCAARLMDSGVAGDVVEVQSGSSAPCDMILCGHTQTMSPVHHCIAAVARMSACAHSWVRVFTQVHADACVCACTVSACLPVCVPGRPPTRLWLCVACLPMPTYGRAYLMAHFVQLRVRVCVRACVRACVCVRAFACVRA